MTSIDEVARAVAGIGERAGALARALEAEYHETFAVIGLIEEIHSDQGAGTRALRLLASAQGQMTEAAEAMREAHSRAEGYAARLRR